ncbi:unnamed protein product [Angiostrongylus costaricensis]|uniref:PAP-associated domain-containing protein n=1 Tax=Angiostrongylus costaricensis TaxID=334426 RepID=A0A158PL93_ANGCS|nr:unnamed protein product [Angiostrongylus costaricensis]
MSGNSEVRGPCRAACNILTNVRHFLATDPIYEQIENVRYVEAEVPMVKIIFVKGPNINLSCCTGSYASGIQKSYLIRGFVLTYETFWEIIIHHPSWGNLLIRWSGKYYARIRGLAMGQRLAPSLAIAFMSKVEAPVTDLGPLLYCRWDSRFASLYMLVKEWAACSGVENSSNGGFTRCTNAFTFYDCTSVFFLIRLLTENRCFHVVLEKYARNVNGEIRYPMVLDFNDEEFLADSPVIEKNSLSVAQLFVLFLDYYCNFNFDRYYICMRDAAVKRSMFYYTVFENRARSADDDGATDDRGSSVFIRDPIDEQNPGRSVRDVTVLQDKMR